MDHTGDATERGIQDHIITYWIERGAQKFQAQGAPPCAALKSACELAFLVAAKRWCDRRGYRLVDDREPSNAAPDEPQSSEVTRPVST